MTCRGPCLPHCDYRCSRTTVLLARSAVAYAVACAVYLVATRTYGTPFLDSLTAHQRAIKGRSAERRGRAFLAGLAVGALAAARLEFRRA